jgi:hypothetical protein
MILVPSDFTAAVQKNLCFSKNFAVAALREAVVKSHHQMMGQSFKCEEMQRIIMKIPLLLMYCVACVSVDGQVVQQPAPPAGSPTPASTVIDVGPHSRTWSNQQGGHPIVELATGMNFWNGQSWVPSNPSFQVSPDGTAFVANQVQEKIRLAANLNAIGSVSITTPDGIVLNTTPVGIGLYDAASGDSLIIGAITNCTGVLVSSNQVVYQNAFAGVSASLVFTLENGSFQQDVVIAENINPADYGFQTNTTRIQIMTEFYGGPQPDEIVSPIYVEQNQKIRNSMATPDFVDEILGFGEFVLASGQAYTAGTSVTNASAPVAKEFTTIGPRTFLIESVEYSEIQGGLNALPQMAASKSAQKEIARGKKAKGGYASIPSPHPGTSRVTISKAPKQIAQGRKGLVIDYIATIGGTLGSATIFQGDTTYFVNGAVTCNGAVTIEGGAVFKYPTNTAYIQLNNTLTLTTASYRPAIFTATDDNSVGDTLNTNIWSGYTGTIQSGGYANPALIISYGLSAPLSYLRFSNAKTGIQNSTYNNVTLAHSEIINCVQGITIAAGSGLRTILNDCLIASITNSILDNGNGNNYYNFTNCTIDTCTELVGGSNFNKSEKVYSVNSVFSSVSAWGAFGPNGDYNGFYNNGGADFGGNTIDSSSSPFRSVGAGKFYLTNSSPFRTAGTTSIDSGLLADLRKGVTTPPLVYSNILISTNIALATQIARDTNSNPDLGYHYDPIDYLVDLFTITNATITVTNGIAIACYNEAGIKLLDGSSITSVGTPLAPNWLVRYQSVQEEPLSLGGTNVSSGQDVSAAPYGSAGPNGTFRFSKFAAPAGGGYHLNNVGNQSFTNLLVQDCELYGGTNYLAATNSAAITLRNSLFWRSAIYASNTSSQVSLAVSNNLFLMASVTLVQPGGGVWYAFDNDFDSCNISTNCWLTNAYNGYLNSTNRLYPTITGDVVTNSLTYQAGPLGYYYQPTNSPLINAGSTTAGQAGLYHYTVTTNLVGGLEIKEANSIVSIGYHYVAVDSNGNPIDTNGDGIPDYLEDANGNGLMDIGEIPWAWNVADGLTLKVLITRPRNGSILP